MREIAITYDSAADAIRALKKIRRFGLGSPRDDLVVELLRAGLVSVPIILVALKIIRLDQAIASYCGYFALRWFNYFVKPAILRRFGPRFSTQEFSSPLSLTFNADVVQVTTENSQSWLKWRAVPAPRVFPKGAILRIAPEQSLVVAASHLPDGMSPRDFGQQVDQWRAEAEA